MEFISYLDEHEWRDIKCFIFHFLINRKLQFTQEEIFEVIKQHLLNLGVSKEKIDCPHFKTLLLEAINDLVKNNILYRLKKTYIPVDYMVLKTTYGIQFADLFYYDGDPKFCINVETLEKSTYIEGNYLLLTGGVNDDEILSLRKPDIPLDEIHRLYHSLEIEGATKSEIINYILNYYETRALSPKDFGNSVSIRRKVRTNQRQIIKKDNS